jgi:DNA-binding NarL/FixJ family response regulator
MSSTSPLPRTAPAIVGRAPEVARVEAAVDAGGAVVLVAEAGMGKTRLARHAAARCAAAGRPVLTGRAGTADGDLPLAALRDALRAFDRAAGAPHPDPLAARFPAMVLPELRAGSGGEDHGRDVVFEAAARWLTAEARRGGGLVLVLEDLHWADATTHLLVPRLARAASEAPFSLVVTLRPDEAEPGSGLDEMRRELSRERLAEEVVLEPLTPGDVAALLRGILGVALAPDLVERFARTGGGNPFVTEELLRAAVEDGSLAPQDGAWRGGEGLPLPWSVSETVLARLRRMEARDRDVLAWAAVAGERFDAELLGEAASLSPRQMAASLERARAAGLVRDDRDGAMAFRHAITHEAILGALVAPERRRRHARLLAAAEARAAAGRAVPLGLLLTHAEGAGDRAAAFAYARRAAARSREVGGEAEALAHTERALARWSEEEGAEARATLLLERGRLLHWVTQHHAAAIAPLEEAARAFRGLGDADRATLAAALAAGSGWWSGRAGALDALRALPGRLTPAAPLELRLEAVNEVARPLMLDRHPREAAAMAEAGLALAERPPTRAGRHGRVDLLITLGTCRIILGDHEGGRALLLETAEHALGDRDAVGACRALHNVAFAEEDAGAMRRHAEAGLEIAREHGLRPSERSFLIALALGSAAAGDLDGAERLCEDAAAVTGPWEGLAHTRLDVGLPRAFALLARGDLEDARAGFAEVQSRLRGAPESGLWTARRGLATVHLAGDDPAAARALLADDLAAGEPASYDRTLALALEAEAAAAEADLDGLGRLAGELSRVAPRHGGTAAAGALRAALGREPDAVDRIAVVERAHDAAGRAAEAARWLLVAAGALARSGAPEAADVAAAARERFARMGADAWRRRAERLMRQLGIRVPSPPATPGAGGLSGRERQILDLLGEGLTNREIAARLVISEKTVGRHLENIYVKLGVHSRLQAVRADAGDYVRKPLA